MKSIQVKLKPISFLISILLLITPKAILAAPIKMEDVVRQTKTRNYMILGNAEKLYQAKENITAARMELLPKVNVWNILAVVTGGFQAEFLEDLAPFLVPANWFRLEENKLLYKSEHEGYRALMANQVLIAKNLFRKISHDLKITYKMEEHVKELDSLLLLLKNREEQGSAPVGSTNILRVRQLTLKDELLKINLLIDTELQQLTMSMGLPEAALADVIIPHLDPVDSFMIPSFDSEIKRVLVASPELHQIQYLTAAIPFVKKEIYYSILGGSNTSRGLAGGIFDNLPAPKGLGFAAASQVRIIEHESQKLVLQKKGVEETLRRQLRLVIKSLQNGLQRKKDMDKRVEMTTQMKENFTYRLGMGEDVNILELVNASSTLIEAEASQISLNYGLWSEIDRLNRLLLINDYRIQ